MTLDVGLLLDAGLLLRGLELMGDPGADRVRSVLARWTAELGPNDLPRDVSALDSGGEP